VTTEPLSQDLERDPHIVRRLRLSKHQGPASVQRLLPKSTASSHECHTLSLEEELYPVKQAKNFKTVLKQQGLHACFLSACFIVFCFCVGYQALQGKKGRTKTRVWLTSFKGTILELCCICLSKRQVGSKNNLQSSMHPIVKTAKNYL